jgi:hypothetical protein
MDMKIFLLILTLIIVSILFTGFCIVNSKKIRSLFRFLSLSKANDRYDMTAEERIKEYVSSITYPVLNNYFNSVQDKDGNSYFVLSKVPVIVNNERTMIAFMLNADWARVSMNSMWSPEEIPITTKFIDLDYPEKSNLTEESLYIILSKTEIPKTKRGSEYLSDIRAFCKSQCILDCQDCVLSKYKRNASKSTKK